MRFGGVVSGETQVEADLREAIDVSRRRRSEPDAHSSGDRMLIVGLSESEVPPDREARRARGLLDLDLIEQGLEGAAGEREVGDPKGDVVEHPGLAIDEVDRVTVEPLCELEVRSVIGVGEEDELGVRFCCNMYELTVGMTIGVVAAVDHEGRVRDSGEVVEAGG